MVNRIEFEKYSLKLDEYGVLWFEFRPYTVLELEDVKKYEEETLKFIDYQPTPFVIDARVDMFSATKEAQDYIARDSKVIPYRLCESVIVNNFGLRLVVDFYIKFNKPKTPTKIFTNESKALKWAIEQKERASKKVV